MSDLITDNSNCVSFEIFPEIKEEDFDLLILFLENRKQSGGGEIQNFESLTITSFENRKKFKIYYEDVEVSKRMIEKRFFKFKNYYLRSYEPSVDDYKNDKYQLLRNELIIQGIKIDEEEDDSIVRMYAEHLEPDNDIAHIQKSHLMDDTFCVVYKNDLNKENLLCRYNKKPSLRNQQIFLIDPFETISFIVFSVDKTKQDFSEIIEKVSAEFSKKEDPRYYFIDLKDKYILFQFENEKVLNEFFDFIKLLIHPNGTNLIIEKILNFEMLNKSFDDVKSISGSNKARKKLVDACVQTELVNYSSLKENIPNYSDAKKRNSKPSSLRSSLSESSSCISSNFSNNSNLDLIVVLDPNEYYSVGLINSRQLFVNFQEELKKIDVNLELVYSDKNLFIRNNGKVAINGLKKRMLQALTNFFEKRAAYKIISIQDFILNDKKLIQNLTNKIAELNKANSAYYFRIFNQSIEGFGCKRVLNDKILELNEFLKTIQNPNKIIKPEMQVNNYDNNTSNFEIKQDTLAFQVLWNMRQIMCDFKNNIKSLNADLDVLDKEEKIIVTCVQRPDPDWLTKIRNYLIEFEKNQVKRTFIPIPTYLKGAKDMDTLKLHVKKYESAVNTVRIELLNHVFEALGYTRAVDRFTREIENKFKTLEDNSKRRISNKLKIIISFKTKSLEYEILKGFNGRYFKELSDGLNKIKASLAAYHMNENDNGFKILCNLDKTEQNNEEKVDEWLDKVNKYRKEFCKKFDKQTFKLPAGKKAHSNLNFNAAVTSLKWISPNEAEVIGIKSEVKKLIEQLVENYKINENLKPSNDEVKQETFLINDLQWFQTRILFEKQYFKYLADNFKDLNVMLDTQLTRICFTGTESDIQDAKNLAFDILCKILGAEVKCDFATLNKMVKNEAFLNNILKENRLCCVIDSKSHNDKFTIYATDLEDIEKCKVIFSKLKF